MKKRTTRAKPISVKRPKPAKRPTSRGARMFGSKSDIQKWKDATAHRAAGPMPGDELDVIPDAQVRESDRPGPHPPKSSISVTHPKPKTQNPKPSPWTFTDYLSIVFVVLLILGIFTGGLGLLLDAIVTTGKVIGYLQ